MKCKFCGNELPEDSKFCPSCGAPVEPENQENQENHENMENPAGAAPDSEPSESEAEASQEDTQAPYEYGIPKNNQETGNDAYSYGNTNQNSYTDYNQYQTGDNPYGQPQKPINGTPYMIFAVLSTLLCCLPLGIAAIVFASRINSLQKRGDYAGAQKAAKNAKIFTIISAVAALVVTIFYLLFAIVLGVTDYDDDSATNVVENLIEDKNDSKKADAKADDSDKKDKKAEAAQPAAVSGELGSSWDSYTVQINDKVLTFPCTKADIEAAGLKMDTDYTPENYMVNAEEYELVYFVDADDNEIMAYAVNNTENAIEVKDCLIGGISVDDYDLENGGLTVTFPGGIQMGATKDAVTGAYGDANDTYEGDSMSMYSWYADDSYYKSCEIDFDAETGLVCTMVMQNFGK